MPSLAWKRLGEYLRETQLLGSIQSTLYWDQNTRMPPAGSSWRGEQLSLLARLLHSRQSSQAFEDLLTEAKDEFREARSSGKLDETQEFERGRNLELLQQGFSRQKNLDSGLVGELATAQAEGYRLWQEAKENADFSFFAPALRKLIALRKEQAAQLAEPRSCWETLAQPFEPDLTKIRLSELFAPLRRRLPELLETVRGWEPSPRSKWDLDELVQQKLCDRLLKDWGRDQSITCVARSPHPFSTTLGPKDFRLTTRVVPGQPLSCFLATAHEWGHSLYEQGLNFQSHQWFAWPLGQATSMAVHESQSLFWENRIARSFSFSERFWHHFAEAGAPIDSGNSLWREMNPLTPGLNRVEADELSYGIHILIRTDLEFALLEEGLSVDDLPEEWNKRYENILGVVPRNDAEGCLQDVHWSEGQFGYFPSYLLGHLISAQIAEAMSDGLISLGIEAQDPIDWCIRTSNESMMLSWLRKEVHPYGRQVNAEQLVQKVTGKPLSSNAFLKYLERKLEQLSPDT